jgi:predicted lipoprotein with Yx(FWY)xxD motif
MRNKKMAVPALFFAGVMLAACGNSSDGSTNATGATPPAVKGSAAPANANAGAGNALVGVGQTSLGRTLTSADGRTLYSFDKDSATASSCNGACATNWPPVIVADGTAPSIAGLKPFGLVTRADGTKQATYRGSPLYRFVGDSGPGQVRGDGVAKVWHALTLPAAAAGSAQTQQTQPAAPVDSAPAAGSGSGSSDSGSSGGGGGYGY